MSDAPERDARTEDPTEKRIIEARERGDVPVSHEVALAANFLTIAALCAIAGPWFAASLGARLGALVEHLDLRLESTADLARAALDLIGAIGLALLPLVAITMIVGVATLLSQTGLALSAERLVPSLERLSPARGLARIIGRNARGDLLKSLVKIGAGAVVVAFWFQRQWPGFIAVGATDARGLGPFLVSALARLFFVIGALHAVVAAADLFWVRVKWRLEHRMTKEELKREHRESEMDPALKSRMRALATARARRRMMAAVPTATMVVTNPTHLAIALRFERDRDPAPIVVAKGADQLALRIREKAAAHNVPIIEDRPLARAMYDIVEVDRAIPAQFYKAVAVIIHHLSRKGVVALARRG